MKNHRIRQTTTTTLPSPIDFRHNIIFIHHANNRLLQIRWHEEDDWVFVQSGDIFKFTCDKERIYFRYPTLGHGHSDFIDIELISEKEFENIERRSDFNHFEERIALVVPLPLNTLTLLLQNVFVPFPYNQFQISLEVPDTIESGDYIQMNKGGAFVTLPRHFIMDPGGRFGITSQSAIAPPALPIINPISPGQYAVYYFNSSVVNAKTMTNCELLSWM